MTVLISKSSKSKRLMKKGDELMFTENDLTMVGIETASLWGAKYISHEINYDEKVVMYLCAEHEEMFYASVSFEEV